MGQCWKLASTKPRVQTRIVPKIKCRGIEWNFGLTLKDYIVRFFFFFSSFPAPLELGHKTEKETQRGLESIDNSHLEHQCGLAMTFCLIKLLDKPRVQQGL
jgi:hypothetical protein